MKRYSFDFVNDSRTVHDFVGRELPSDGDAGEHAKLLAIHLQYAPDSACAGWNVLVRDDRCKEVHSVAVPALDPGAGNRAGFAAAACAS
jgi:hypothetical protein